MADRIGFMLPEMSQSPKLRRLVPQQTPCTPKTLRYSDVLADALRVSEEARSPLRRNKKEAGEACVICLEPFEDEEDEDDLLPFKVPAAASLPCRCQARVEAPARVHEACLRSWVGACARRAARHDDPAGVTCPLCRAPLEEKVAKALELAARARAALAQCPHAFAARPLCGADGVIRCVVKVHDKHPRVSPRAISPRQAPSEAPLLLSLFVEGEEYQDLPLLVARAPKVLGSSRLATKFEILFGPRPDDPNEKPAAIISRNCLGTRWTVADPVKRRCTIDYEANRFANRPRAMHIELDDGATKLRSRAPEYSPRLHGFCLDFFGRARLASVRNFQIVDANADLVPGDEEARCLLLFGRWSSDSFHLDVKAPFSIVDAFAIAVSSFATKIATI
ncbi:hypothetical protein CTAYLR_003442 [Chrysophaeum taylorii]|uniref:RING-type domain-containing protein n=1 Tax=Chrysophaeum taylorii TaxID=2483200 RepID=A0AAD7U8K6_9STRA|nr:hypothetical protein CTAYLR_003442 [Chrysophaeum taylorii]